MSCKPVLGYWKTRCFAQPIRLLLEYTGTSFEDKLFQVGPAPDYDKTCWHSVKDKLGLDFPNLPYYLDGDVKISQSHAILRYIARKHDLCGKTEEEKVRVDILDYESIDFRYGLVSLCYDPDFEKLKGPYLEKLPATLKQFSDFLGDRKWFAGDSITFPDFEMYEFFDQTRILAPNSLKDTPNLQRFLTRFEALEPIKKYMESPRFMKSPLYNVYAAFKA